jgi:hypothetical protein
MSRAVLRLVSANIRARALNWIRAAPPGTIVEFRESKRTTEQNAKMWAMLTEISLHGELRGQHWTPDQWKAIFMKDLGHEIEVLPTLDGRSWFPANLSSSNLSKGQMSELIESMLAWGVQNGVVFHDEAGIQREDEEPSFRAGGREM